MARTGSIPQGTENQIGSVDPAGKHQGCVGYCPLVSIVLPAFNESALLENNLGRIVSYLHSLEQEFRWEIIVVNDGSMDQTGEIAEKFAKLHPHVRICHHPTNLGLGQAFKSGFSISKGDYVVTLDVDLSYSPDHIGKLLGKIIGSKAQMVLASPYMVEGTISNVPLMRRKLSIWANRFLSLFARGNISTLTCMVRAYEGEFVRTLDLRAKGMEIMPEMIYKAMILRAKIEQIPANLDWGIQNAEGQERKSSMMVARHIFSTILSGFNFRPFMFFIIPGVFSLLVSLYAGAWVVIHAADQYVVLDQYQTIASRVSASVAAAFSLAPHTFIIGGMGLMISIQLISLGILAMQSKNYFEEVFHLGSTIYSSRTERER